MQLSFNTRPEIEPFEFQNRTVYRDLLRLMSTVREFQKDVSTDLGKIFIQNLFQNLFIISKNIGYSSNNKDSLAKMNILASSINHIFDSITALDICFEAKWIPSIQYFESKQILEKTYWAIRDDQQMILKSMDEKFSTTDFQNIKHFQ